MSWDEKPDGCPKVFNNHNPYCEGCSQRTECLQSSMGEKLDAYIKVTEKSLEAAERWEKEQKANAAKAGSYVRGALGQPKKRDKKELLDEFLTDFCDFIGVLNSCLAAAGIEIPVADQISLFVQWQHYRMVNAYQQDEGENP